MKTFSLVSALALFALAAAPLARATDLSITASSLLPSTQAKYANGIAGAAISAGALVYESSADGRYYAADANVTTAVAVAGIAGHATTAAGQPMSIVYEDPALTVGATLDMAAPVYVLSATAGGIAPSADIAPGWYPVVVGVAISTTQMYFKPRAIQGTAAATAMIFDLGNSPRFAAAAPRFLFVRRDDELSPAA